MVVDLPISIDVGSTYHVIHFFPSKPFAKTVHRVSQFVGTNLTAAIEVKYCKVKVTIYGIFIFFYKTGILIDMILSEDRYVEINIFYEHLVNM